MQSDGLQDRNRRGSGERRPAGSHLVQNAAQAEEISAGVDVDSVGLLGGHVGRSAKDDARSCQVVAAIGLVGQSEVEELHAARRGLKPDVAGFDVTVNKTAGVRFRQRRTDFPPDAQNLGGRQPRLPRRPRFQRLSGE